MALSAVELYDRLKPQLGESENKALIEYVGEKIHGEVATKEDLLLQKAELKEDVALLKEDMALMKAELKSDMAILKAEMKDDLWKLRLMVVIALVVVVVLNPKVLELVG
jgi:uncharacterized small protein (DUF1192 family)